MLQCYNGAPLHKQEYSVNLFHWKESKTYETRTEDVYSETQISVSTQKILFVLFACRNIWEAGKVLVSIINDDCFIVALETINQWQMTLAESSNPARQNLWVANRIGYAFERS